jgi:hypothetical protein
VVLGVLRLYFGVRVVIDIKIFRAFRDFRIIGVVRVIEALSVACVI